MDQPPKKLSSEEFLHLELEDDMERYELHGGEMVGIHPPRPRHCVLQTLLNQLFGFYQLRHEEFRSVVEAPLELFSDEVCRPDVLVLLDPKDGGRCLETEECFSGPPEIVIEILSSKPIRDLVRKRELYARAGISEYWVLSPEDKEAAFLRLDGSVYREAAILREDFYETPRLPGFRLDVAALFRRDIYALAAALTESP
jgi:Uma2 family endonuclease